MSAAKQLYQLQEIDLEVESSEQAVSQIASQLGESEVVVRAQAELTLEQQRLDELKRQQHSAEWEIDDLISKLTPAEEKLYSGRIGNPKELTSLQQEVDALKVRRNQLEAEAIEIMDKVELVTASVTEKSSEFKRLEAEWHRQQQQLSVDMEHLKTILADLEQKRELLLAGIDPEAVESYRGLKKQKGTAVAKVERGICRGCGISLTTAMLQRAKSGSQVQCSNCRRILFPV